MSRPRSNVYVAASEPVISLTDVSLALRIDSPEENQFLAGLIEAATQWAQDYCWSQFVTATWKQRMECFYCEQIPLHPNPVSDVTGISYVDSGGTTQTLTETTQWLADCNVQPAIIYPAYNLYWPTTRGFRDDVIVTFTAGYGAASAVPQAIKTAITMLVGNWYEHRTAAGCDMTEIPFGVKPLLDNYSFRVPK